MPIINPVIKDKTPEVEALPVTPSAQAQTIQIPQNKDGYNPVNVSAVTSSVDANIVSGNIKNGVSILGVVGDYTGGSGPTYYVEKTKDNNNVLQKGSQLISLSGITKLGAGALCYAYYQNTNVSGQIDFSNITEISGDNVCCSAFEGSTGLTGAVNLSSLTKINGIYACRNMFKGNTGITSVNLSSLSKITASVRNSSSPCDNTFSECTGLISVILPQTLSCTVDRGMTYMFAGCTSLTSANVNFETMAVPTNSYQYQFMFQRCTGLTIVSLPKIVDSLQTGALYGTFQYCTSLTTLDLRNLTKVNTNYELEYICSGCTSLVNVNFSSFQEISGNKSLVYAFQNCTNLTNLRFPALSNVGTRQTNQFNYMLSGVTGCTVHFPIAMQSTIGSWSDVTNGFGGTNTTVLFDIVTSLTGADTLTYTRREKDNTATTTAWENNNALYYTSGLTEPQVGDTIYGDDSCTIAVTTVTAIA